MRTDIAGFAGFAERGPLQAAVRLDSWNDFRRVFGGFIRDGYLAYAVRGFFGTGGTTCYISRIGAAATPASTALLPLPAAETDKLITHLAEATASGQGTIKLDSADVVSVGDVIAIGSPPETGAPPTVDYVSIVSVVDDQTITVQPLPLSAHPQGEPVYLIPGSALQLGAGPGSTDITVVKSAVFQQGDLVSVQGDGISELRVIAAPPAGQTLRLAQALDQVYREGAVVRKYLAAFTVRAYSPGDWGNRIRLFITPLKQGDAVQEFSLLVTVDASEDPGQPIAQEFYPRLSIDPTNASPTPIYAPSVVNAASQLITIHYDRVVGSEVEQTDDIPAGTELLVGRGPVAKSNLQLEGGSDGATGFAAVTTQDFLDALDQLRRVDEIAILSCPDAVARPSPPVAPAPPAPIVSPCNGKPAAAATALAPSFAGSVKRLDAQGWSTTAIYQAMISQCAQLRYRVAVLDTPISPQFNVVPGATISMQPAAALAWLNGQPFYGASTRFAAVYYPWIDVPDEAAFNGPSRSVPPSGHVAGAFAYTDNNFGVRKPPANVALDFAVDVTVAVGDREQGFLNDGGINAIRAFPGRGIRVWGARSISRDPDWRYIHTRRLMSMIEDSVEKSSQWVVFESNTADLRRMLTHSLEVFLEAIWRSGGLKGARPEEGYFVKCDDTNNPQISIDAGLLICQVGIAIAAPMEFLVFELRRSVEGSQVVEA